MNSKKYLKGNIYLGKVSRIEASLQAAFVDIGSEKNGFLAFGEIHPNYFQIPVADREALIQAEIENEEEHSNNAEINELEEAGITVSGRALVSEKCSLILPSHVELDLAREKKLKEKKYVILSKVLNQK